MTNVEKCEQLGILGDVRERCGAVDENDTAFDEEINKFSNQKLVEQWCGWHLGDGSWWLSMLRYFNRLNALDNE